MVLSASQANSLTLSSIQITDEQKLDQELASAEARIRQVAGLGRFKLGYNALILGNPVDDPQDDSNLTDLQIQFRDHFNDQGYIVSLEPETGFGYSTGLRWEPKARLLSTQPELQSYLVLCHSRLSMRSTLTLLV